MKMFRREDSAYWVYPCTAISRVDDEDLKNESARQDALLVISNDGTEVDQHVVFGCWEMPGNEQDFDQILDNWENWEYAGDNDSVRCPELGEGKKPWEKYFWSLPWEL